MHRKALGLFLIAFAVGSIAPTSGCATKSLYSNIGETPDYIHYAEKVDQILISADGKKVVFIGPEYHYIFDAPEHMAALLDSPLHKGLAARFSTFSVSSGGAVDGLINLTLEKPDEGGLELARGYGFDDTSDAGTFRDIVILTGKRYRAGTFNGASANKPLNTSYVVQVREKAPMNAKKALALLTPVTIAADGVLTILSVPLLPVVLPMAGIGYGP